MARIDKDGNPIPILKPEGGKKRKPKATFGKKGAQPKEDPGLKPESLDRKRQNNINRNFGKSTERKVASLVGGTRVPMSGAVKNSVHNLEGDVSVRAHDGRKVLALIEVKGQTPKEGAKSFQIKKSVLKQAQEEAELQKAYPIVWYHLKGEEYTEDWGMMPMHLLLELIDAMRDLHDMYYTQQDLEDTYEKPGR